MKFSEFLLFLALAGVLTHAHALDEAVTSSDAIELSYLSHWFTVDSAETNNLVLTPIKGVKETDFVQLTFTSDDGHKVNGILAHPTGLAGVNKIALAIHPMGSDQYFWWRETSPLSGHKLTASLREQGYTVISLDARRHGESSTPRFGPRELLKRAHSDEPRLYIETIIGTVRDYRTVLTWAKREFQADEVLALGYSMGAQISLLLASYEPSVNSLLVMVPPYVSAPTSPVAPRAHVKRISKANVLWLAGTNDPHSNRQQTEATFNKISSANKHLTWFESGHRLPEEFVRTALAFFESLSTGGKQ